MKVKTIKTTILEGIGTKPPLKRPLSPRCKADIMEYFLMLPMDKIFQLQQDYKQTAFVQQLVRLLCNNKLGEYFDVLKMCREMAEKSEKGKLVKMEMP